MPDAEKTRSALQEGPDRTLFRQEGSIGGLIKSERIWRGTQRLLGLLYPPRCPVCDEILDPEDAVYSTSWDQLGRRNRTQCLPKLQDNFVGVESRLRQLPGIHEECYKRIIFVKDPVCMRCGRPLASESEEYCADCAGKRRVDGCFQGKSLMLYRGPVKSMLYRFKYKNRREYAAYFARAALTLHGRWLGAIEPEVILPVPMYRPKQRRRGYNQAAVFAKELSRLTGIPWKSNHVLRIRSTRPMKELDDIQREKNLKNAFQIADEGVKYKRVLLVDDIYTTGSTVEEVARTLTGAGAEAVYFLSISIGKGF